MNIYAPYELLRAVSTSITGGEDELLALYSAAASRRIEQITGRVFMPYIEEKSFDFQHQYELVLEEDLLNLITLKTNNGATTIPNAAVKTISDNRRKVQPYNRIEIVGDMDTTSPIPWNDIPAPTRFFYKATPQDCNLVEGEWGYHEDYSSAWFTESTLTAGIDNVVTTFAIADVSGPDTFGIVPAIKIHNLIRIDSELMLVLDRPDDISVVVRRGVNGSTAAAHLINANIEVFNTIYEVIQAAIMIAIYYDKQKDAQIFEVVGIEGMGSVKVPMGIPDEAASILSNLTKEETRAEREQRLDQHRYKSNSS